MDLGMCTAVILAAGKGTRMKSSLPKVLHKILDWPLIFYPLKLLQSCDRVSRTIVVLGHEGHRVKEAIESFDVDIAWQQQQLGTAHAVSCALELLSHKGTQCLIMCGDMPLMRRETLNAFLEFHYSANNHVTVLSALFDCPTGYGRIVRDDKGSIEAIVEEKDASPMEKAIKEVNTGTYLVDSAILHSLLTKIGNENAQGEFYLTDIIHIAKKEGKGVAAFTLDDPAEAMGVNSRFDLARAEAVVLDRLRKYHMDNGVTLVMPNTIYIGNDVTIQNDVVIGPFSVIKGRTSIASGVQIGPYSYIEDQVIGEGQIVPPYSRLIKEENQ